MFARTPQSSYDFTNCDCGKKEIQQIIKLVPLAKATSKSADIPIIYEKISTYEKSQQSNIPKIIGIE